ncbi:solute carrier family 4 member 1b (Diego blood group) isoform X3 [Astatotilapia calliptera]|uniref:solute carrier family 4 member 1b (Diego blood group) isoform X3 n=1 Tax=Astatotilapia calliptera TaxID=8154 RepID=UPI000E428275|nr:band 3 anion exchange protein-like isoform X3 [Astatotilapia calliptera]
MKEQEQQGYWQEKGRWVGYEESFDPQAQVWVPTPISCLTFRSLIQLRHTMSPGVTILDCEEKTLDTITEKMVSEMVNKKEIRSGDREGVLNSLLQNHSQTTDPESQMLTGTDLQKFSVKERTDESEHVEASMVLVGTLDFLEKPTAVFVRLKEAVALDSALEAPEPVRFVFLLIGPSSSDMDYYETGRAMAALMANKVFNQTALQAKSARELINAVSKFMDCSIVIPPTEIKSEAMLSSVINFQKKLLQDKLQSYDLVNNAKVCSDSIVSRPPIEDPLSRTGRPFGGMIRDIKRRYQYYKSDITDALNAQVLAAIIFIYFAALSPAITFGGLLAYKVDNMMGVPELLISTSIQGIIFCFVAAQPVLVIGFSGPLLVFEEAFYAIFKAHPLILNYEHVNASAEYPWHPKVEEIVTYDNSTGNKTLIVNTIKPSYPNTALLSMCLMMGCFFIAYFLRQFKNGTFLPGKIRRLIGDFGVPIAIVLMTLVDYNVQDTYTQKLIVPRGLTVSNPEKRGWLINPFGEHKPFPVWLMFASCIPAVLVFILIFLESQITTLIVSKPERKMVKGSGFHFDLLVLVGMGGLSAIFGVPWLSAATVRSVTHANALTVMSKGPKPVIEKVMEQRISGIVVALLVGLSVLMEPILKMIPMAALFGIFLYMGITSLNGIQLWDRVQLLLIPKKYHPNEPYATRVSTGRMHLYTAIQVVCLGVLWLVKSSQMSLALPFVLILTIPLRMLMTGHLFTELEMKCLDADDAKVTFEEEPGKDVYCESQMPL